jgi:Family of unknown function (DUF5670)
VCTASAGPTALSERAAQRESKGGGATMLFLVFLLVILWLLGFVTKYTLGGLLHILLVVAIVLGLVNFIRGRGL